MTALAFDYTERGCKVQFFISISEKAFIEDYVQKNGIRTERKRLVSVHEACRSMVSSFVEQELEAS